MVIRCDEAEGFQAVSGISAIFPAEKTDMHYRLTAGEYALNYHGLNNIVTSMAQVINNGVGSQFQDDDLQNKQWVDDSKDILDLLKNGLQDHGLEDRYNMLYYWLNGSIAHGNIGYIHDKNFDCHTVQELLLPDKDMIQTTKEQILHAEGIVDALEQSINNDRSMRNRLADLSCSFLQVPELYLDSRQTAYGLEEKIGKHVLELVVRRLIYLPIGFRPSGRSWPYLDASSPNDGNYGYRH